MPLFAELDWGVVTTTIGTTVVTLTGGLGAITRFVVGRFEKMQESRIKHEQDMMNRYEKLQADSQADKARMYQEMMTSERDKTKILMDVNQKGLDTIAALTREVAEQGTVIEKMTATIEEIYDKLKGGTK